MAADLAARPAKTSAVVVPQISPVRSWTGLYVGGHLGGEFSGASGAFGRESRFLGGLQFGADYQFAPNWVLGAEGQYSWLAGNGQTSTLGRRELTRDRNGIGALTGRLGYTWGAGLLYVKGGYAYQDTSYGVRSRAGAPVAFAVRDNKSGYTVGAGLEYMLAPNWSTKLEYQYYDFGTARFVAPSPGRLVRNGTFDSTLHTVSVGVNYRF
ncbi:MULTISPECIES: outer membrane protein [Bradyrhizobium]|uniref:Porin family protein n=2 Tax=Bradyrhizobium TaxID=374 RepID=A0ABS5G8Y2_9BRAD|nr:MULTISPECIES: outer membrane beta-barrel protein [Bradyrhizobium]RTL91616.1 MAG: porin family protein [Bradyrhizobiaceae bacterium]MBR1137797.1 porin family protein [Bradyrhizobium denitrificans]MCL8487829.1 outer membrane beta-barrel protein [Bradyrhizobium denitrificans]MDU0958154.1 outer membrane beta-barrel protein [Bradyrhizobium sp.]MDU1495189.1 outer membrane beta-barrel protein [Bradyrhizobium sp.]